MLPRTEIRAALSNHFVQGATHIWAREQAVEWVLSQCEPTSQPTLEEKRALNGVRRDVTPELDGIAEWFSPRAGGALARCIEASVYRRRVFYDDDVCNSIGFSKEPPPPVPPSNKRARSPAAEAAGSATAKRPSTAPVPARRARSANAPTAPVDAAHSPTDAAPSPTDAARAAPSNAAPAAPSNAAPAAPTGTQPAAPSATTTAPSSLIAQLNEARAMLESSLLRETELARVVGERAGAELRMLRTENKCLLDQNAELKKEAEAERTAAAEARRAEREATDALHAKQDNHHELCWLRVQLQEKTDEVVCARERAEHAERATADLERDQRNADRRALFQRAATVRAVPLAGFDAAACAPAAHESMRQWANDSYAAFRAEAEAILVAVSGNKAVIKWVSKGLRDAAAVDATMDAAFAPVLAAADAARADPSKTSRLIKLLRTSAHPDKFLARTGRTQFGALAGILLAVVDKIGKAD